VTSRIDPVLIEQINTIGRSARDLNDKCESLKAHRERSPETSQMLDRHLLLEIARLRQGLVESQASLAGLKQLNDKLTAPPWFPGVFLRTLSDQRRAVVAHGGSVRVVELADGVDAKSLALGDDILLSDQLNVLLASSPCCTPNVGETGTLQQRTLDGRLVLESRNEQVVVQPAERLDTSALREGDALRWDKLNYIAYERVDWAPSCRYTLTEIPDVRPQQIGGQRAAFKALLAALTTTLVAPHKAEQYGLSARQSVLLVGPPGCGKTLMARATVSETTRISGTRCHFAVVKPSEWESPFVGVTQQNIRDCFRAVRAAAGEREFAVLFLDEIESVARIRGSAVGHHSDKFLAALLAELDGFTARGRVAVVAATNRKDLLDPALLERLAELEIVVPRPDLRGTREIFEIHLAESLPFCPNGASATHTRQALIDHAVSRLFDPNSETGLCTIRFRDGKTRQVTARQLISGRVVEQICRAALQSAFLRDVEAGEVGLRIEDIDEAVTSILRRMATTLTPLNVRSYLDDLPQDMDVVGVEPLVLRSRPGHRYLNQTMD
jgi:proteasome-associated ATPase